MIGSVSRWVGAASNYVRTARGLREFVRTPPPADCLGLLRHQLENRESTFLDTLRRVVFDNPGHPYRQMFHLAQCSHQDLANLIKRDGLEAALGQLRAAGVSLSQDEFKGATPIVRQGREIPASPESFRNPLAHGTMQHVTSGSRGRAIQSFRSSKFLLHQEAMHELVVREFGLKDRAQVVLRSTLPSALGLQTAPSVLARAIVLRVGTRPVKADGMLRRQPGWSYWHALPVAGFRFRPYFPTTIFPRRQNASPDFVLRGFLAWSQVPLAPRFVLPLRRWSVGWISKALFSW